MYQTQRHIMWFPKMMAILVISMLVGCNATKYVPEGQYLLDKTKVTVVDKPNIDFADLNGYLRQKPNSEILGFWKLQLHIWNTAPRDTTKKSNRKLAENAHKMGEAPVIYDPSLTEISMHQLERAMENKGYFNAMVDTTIAIKKRKISLTYVVTANQPYKIKDYSVSVKEHTLDSVAHLPECLVHTGENFNTATLDAERDRLSDYVHNHGYYYFDKSFLEYEADSTVGDHQIALKLHPAGDINELPDSVRMKLYTKYGISRVCFHIDYDPAHLPEGQVLTRQEKDGYEYSFIKQPLLRQRILRKYCAIHPGERYSAQRVERTYSQLNGLNPIKYVDISFVPDPNAYDSLICHVTISRTKLNSVSAELDGTYSAGDWGIAVGVGYANKNIFRGAERLSLGTRFSYEWRQNGGRAIEAKAEVGLRFPNTLDVKLAYQYQRRPDEFTRNIAAAGLYYTVRSKPHSHWQHIFNFIDINYVYLPWISEEFKQKYIDPSSVLKYSYEDHFIMAWSYTGRYSTQRQGVINKDYIRFSYTFETAGNFLYAISKAANLPQNESGSYTLLNIPFSQYAKADVDFTYHQVLVPNHRLVYHIGIGAVVPYLNASVVPFEKRYFSGGSNSVRGWQSRTLGPGGFMGTDGALTYDLQTGDIHLDLNLEYRYHVWNFIELAAFTDAGNIWTIRDYPSQPHGCFQFDEFYKQIAWSYGIGLRFDLSILILRIDYGVKLYDPTRLYTDNKVWRTVPNGLSWNSDMTLHFAIGYPF